MRGCGGGFMVCLSLIDNEFKYFLCQLIERESKG